MIFFAQAQDPNQVKQAQESSTATDALQSGVREMGAVENSALAIVDAADLLKTSARKCANGRAVPVKNADWTSSSTACATPGMVAYKAAQAKDQDKILDAAKCSPRHEPTATTSTARLPRSPSAARREYRLLRARLRNGAATRGSGFSGREYRLPRARLRNGAATRGSGFFWA